LIIYLALTLIFIPFNFLNSQELSVSYLDSLFENYVFMRTSKKVGDKPILISDTDRKCGFGLAAAVVKNFDRFNAYQQSILKTLFQRPQTDTSIITPSGFCRIHYNKTGSSSPGYSLIELAKAIDSVYRFEVNFLGYPPPPPDNGMGGDNRFDFYIIDLGSGYYGFTQPETHIGNEKYTSYTVIDNDYVGYPTTGLNGAKATVAHEFHHAIQIGNYILRESDLFYYEISSTAMEEFVFDDINDYYFYLPDYFNNPGRPFILNNGYNLSIWNIFLQNNFGHQLLKRIWELIPMNRALISIALALSERGYTFKDVLNKFGIWNYYTGYRHLPGKFFEEARNYPLIVTTNPMPFSPPSRLYSIGSKATTNFYLKISYGMDTLIVILSNSDIISGIDSVNKTFPISYTLYSNKSTGTRKIAESFSADFDSPYKNFYSLAEILNDIVVNGDSTFPQIKVDKDIFVFPNPYILNKNYAMGNYLNIQIKTPLDFVDLYVYTSSMKLIYSSNKQIGFLSNGSKGIRWDLKDNSGNNVPSGVYFLVVKSGGKTLKEKVAIFNE